MFSVAQNVALIRATGGVEVAKGTESTFGHKRDAPVTVALGDDGSGRVLAADLRVVIAAGTLTGITARDGIGDALTVDGESVTVIDIVTPDGEEDGDMLELILKRNA